MCAAYALALLAALAPLPALAAAGQPQIELPAAVLERYTGFYQLTETMVLTITRSGTQLFAQATGQPAAEIFPETAASFVYRIVDARVDFMPDPPAQITALVLHQHGADVIAQRIDAAQAQRIAAAVSERVHGQSPAASSESAARRLLAGLVAGTPNYDEMSPELAAATQAQLPQLRAALTRLGPVQSLVFQGIGSQGWDLYVVHHEHGLSQLRILMGASGTITGALFLAGP